MIMNLKDLLETAELLKQTIEQQITAYGKGDVAEGSAESFRGMFFKGATLPKYSESEESIKRLGFNVYNCAKEFCFWTPKDEGDIFVPSWRVDE